MGRPTESDEELKVEEIAEQYLDRLQAGETPDREALLTAHPGLAGLLERELALVEALHRARLHQCGEETPLDSGGAGPIRTKPGDATAPNLPEDPPARVGPFQILEVLGVGGMGAVYLAEQIQPVRRRVALKLIKLGMDTREVVRRFEHERQALAMMNHPNIAQVFEAGAADDGRPYFVMEHVPGDPITDFCGQDFGAFERHVDLVMLAFASQEWRRTELLKKKPPPRVRARLAGARTSFMQALLDVEAQQVDSRFLARCMKTKEFQDDLFLQMLPLFGKADAA